MLLCDAWQMRAHSEVLRARSHALAEMLGFSDGQQARTTIKLRLNMDPGALGIAVNYMYFNEVRTTSNIFNCIVQCTHISVNLFVNYYSVHKSCLF